MYTPSFFVVLFILLMITSVALADGEVEEVQLGIDAAVSNTDLESTRGLGGGDFLQWNDMNLDADLSDNIVYSSENGDNTISNDAFSEASGFATVIQNSGNHVIIQNATIVNLTMEQ